MMKHIIDAIGIEPYYTELDGSGVIYCADCMDILPKIPEKSIDLVLTDPPYGLNYQSNRGAATGNLKDKIENDKIEDWLELAQKLFSLLEIISAIDSEWYVFCGGGGGEPVLAHLWLLLNKLKIAKVKNLLIWDKMYPGMGWDWRFQYETIFQLQIGRGLNNNMDGSNRVNILKCRNIIPQAGEHPTEKPVNLIKQLAIPKLSNLILDPFLGSGTTAVAAKQLGRKYIGIEMTEKYCEITVQRLAQGILI